MTGNIRGDIGKTHLTLETLDKLQKANVLASAERQEETKDDLFSVFTEMTQLPIKLNNQRKKTDKSSKARIKELLSSGDKLGPIEKAKLLDDTAGKFQQKNDELDKDKLLSIRKKIKPQATKEEILATIAEEYGDPYAVGSEGYGDPSNIDDVLDFLLETTEGELFQTVKEVKDELHDKLDRQIIAGKNIAKEARAAAEKGLGTTTSLRDQYRDLTGNPRDSNTLFHELNQQYEFKDIKKMVDFFLHSLGSDMKAKGPSIPRGELHRLISETRNLQSILGVYRFFSGRMHLVETLFDKEGLEVPPELTYETMTKQFMTIVGDRYPSSSKVLQTVVKLGLGSWVPAKIIAISQFRDGIREVAIDKIYKSLQHRDECLTAIIEALEDLEDELEAELKRQEEEEGGLEEGNAKGGGR